MKNNLLAFIKIIIFIFLIILLIINNNLISNNIVFGFQLFLTKVFPSLFPFFIISSLLINYGFVEFLAFYLNKIFKILFKTNENACFIFIMSMITGTPSNAIYTKELLEKKLINTKDANKIIMFSFFANPVFIISMGYYIFENNWLIILLILCIHYFTNIIIGLIFRNFNKNSSITNKKSFNEMIKTINKNKQKFFPCFVKAINNAINSMLLILGTIITFTIIISLIKNINIPYFIKVIICGLIEFSNGLNMLINYNISMLIKGILMICFLSFGSLSVHTQIKSIIADTSISYKYFFIARIIHAFISMILFIVLYFLFY